MMGLLIKAKQGCAHSQQQLGIMYLTGKYTQQSNSEAFKWLKKAAEQGLPQAQFYVGMMFYHGEVITKSNSEAIKWYKKAIVQGNIHAKIALEQL